MPLEGSVKESGIVMENKDTRMIVIKMKNENLIIGSIYKLKYLNLIPDMW
jgi:hypothetical protein